MTGGGFRSFTAGEVLTAANVQDFLMDQAVMNFNGTAARGSALPSPSAGMVAHVGGGTATIYNGSSWVRLMPETGGKILQIVRATDSTQRSTTSTSYVDVTGMTVTITPQKSDSAIIVIATVVIARTSEGGRWQITDNSNNALSGADASAGLLGTANDAIPTALIGYSTPATTSATTYKLRFRTNNGTGSIITYNDIQTGQMYAIEVSA